MLLINFRISLQLKWFVKCFLVFGTVEVQSQATDTKFYVPVVTLSTPDNAKLLEQLKSDFERVINWNKYQSKLTPQAQNRYLDFFN